MAATPLTTWDRIMGSFQPLMKRATLFLALAVVCTVSMTSCSETSDINLPTESDGAREAKLATSHMNRFTDEKDGISFNYPDNWDTHGAKSKFDLLAFQVFKGFVSGRAAVAHVGDSTTLEQVAISPNEVPVKGKKCPTTIISRDHIQVGNQPAIQVTYSYEMPIPHPYQRKVVQTYVLKDGNDYIFNFGTPADLFDDFSDVRKQILDSVQFSH
jgi:hypothetical protein